MVVEPFFWSQPSGIANVDIPWTGHYEFIRLLVLGARGVTDDDALRLRTSADGGSTFDSGASDYNFRHITQGATSQADEGPTGDAFPITRTGQVGNVAGEESTFEVFILNPFDSNRQTQIISNGGGIGGGGSTVGEFCFGSRDNAGRVDTIRLFLASSTNWVVGTIVAEGFINSSAL